MKKKLLLFIVAATMIFATACSAAENAADNETEEQVVAETDKETVSEGIESGVTDYNIEVYSGDCGIVTLKSITEDAILFSAKNATDETIDYSLSIALDGEMLSGWMEYAPVSAGSTEDIVFNLSSINYTEHKYMSIYGVMFLENGDCKIFDVCDLKIGETQNQENSVPSGENIYTSENVKVDYTGADAQGVSFTIDNSESKTVTVYFEGLYINDDDADDYGIYSITIPAHSKGTFDIDILSMNSDYYASDVNAVSGCMNLSIDGEGVIDRFQFNTGEDSSTGTEETNQQETEQFVAQGNTVLFNFLDATSSNGYNIENPQNDGVYVNAVATGDGGSFDICYMVEEQHVYKVEVFADGSVPDGFKDCVRAMALSLNPNISDDGISEAMNYVLECTDESYVIEDTLFRFDSADNKLIITY